MSTNPFLTKNFGFVIRFHFLRINPVPTGFEILPGFHPSLISENSFSRRIKPPTPRSVIQYYINANTAIICLERKKEQYKTKNPVHKYLSIFTNWQLWRILLCRNRAQRSVRFSCLTFSPLWIKMRPPDRPPLGQRVTSPIRLQN